MHENNKKSLKKILVSSTIGLACLWLIILFYGIFFQGEKQLKTDLTAKHLVAFNINIPITQQNSDNTNKQSNIAPIPPVETNITPVSDRPKIALIITNLGTNKYLTDQALQLPNTITLGFLPYTTALKSSFEQAINSGFDVFLYLPFEPVGYPNNDPGPYPILANNSLKQNIDTINNTTQAFPGIKGVYASFRENLIPQQTIFEPLLQELQKNGLSLMLGKPYNHELPAYLKPYTNLANSSLIIDLAPDSDAIKQNLAQLITLAQTNKTAIGYINTYPLTLTILAEWLPQLAAHNIELVPLSSIIGK